VEVFFNGLQNRVWVQLHVPHDFRKHVPFDLRKRKKKMLIRQQRVFAAASLLGRTIDNALCGFAYLAW
jgi:hypothetical protein